MDLSPSGAADVALRLTEKATDSQGYVLYTRIKWKSCHCGHYIFWRHYWYDNEDYQTDWRSHYATSPQDKALGQVWGNKYEAYTYASAACKEHLAEWKKENADKLVDENAPNE